MLADHKLAVCGAFFRQSRNFLVQFQTQCSRTRSSLSRVFQARLCIDIRAALVAHMHILLRGTSFFIMHRYAIPQCMHW